jgi:hypothetical protein
VQSDLLSANAADEQRNTKAAQRASFARSDMDAISVNLRGMN